MRAIRWTRSIALGFLLLFSAGGAMAALQSDPVALLVKLQGDVTIERSDGGDGVAGTVGMQLNAGDRVVVAQGGEAVVLYRTGKMVKAAAPVVIEEAAEGESSSLFANTVRTLGQVATTDARTQPNRQGMIRPIAGAPVPLAPRNTIKVLELRPEFTWMSVPAAKAYVIQIQRQGADAPRPVRFTVGTDTTWSWPQAEAPLIPGATYVWTVGGEGIGRVAEPQTFTVASSADLSIVEQTLNGLIQAGIDPSSDGLFLAALAYRDAGLFYEAQRALDSIEAQGNASGRAFYMLRGEVYDAIGDAPRAETAFDMADQSPAG
jgi:hypothetical protein